MANSIVENTTIVCRLTGEPKLRVSSVSSNVTRLGYEPGEFLQSPDLHLSIIHPEDRPTVEDALDLVIQPEASVAPLQIRLRAKDGIYHWVDGRLTAVRDGEGRLLFVEGVLSDINRRKLVEERIRFANTLLATLMQTSPDGILVVDIDGRIVSFNDRLTAVWKLPMEMFTAGGEALILEGATATVKYPAEFLARIQEFVAHPERDGQDEIETRDGRCIQRDTSPLLASDGTNLGRVWSFRDITDRKRAEAMTRYTARHDGLTGLSNRGVFMEAVGHAMSRATSPDKCFAVLVLDLDHFKDVNDTLGHEAGDELLCAVAERLRLNVRRSDTVARLGGDEFAVIATVSDEMADTMNLADALVASIGQPFSIQGSEVVTAASIGIAKCEPDDTAPEELVAHADMARYRAKADGGGGYRFFNEQMNAEVRARVTVIAELRKAITSGQLFVEYQPQVHIETGRIVGLEALVRWRHPERGVLAPGEFTAIAEKAGLIVALGNWVLRDACRQGKEWMDAGVAPVLIAINVAALQFKRPLELEMEISAALAGSGMPPDWLELELTEGGIMDVSRAHNDVLVRLKQSGIKFAIDDFGTGYSSLDYLRRYPADCVKIAQEFVRMIVEDAGSASIVRATIGLCRELGMISVAEGVETAEQLSLLRAWGCLEAQGYYFAKPLSPEAILPLLLRGRIERPLATEREELPKPPPADG